MPRVEAPLPSTSSSDRPGAVMTDSLKWHEFMSRGETWAVARRTATESHQKDLCFRRGTTERVLVFSRGARPSDSELESMGEGVLTVLLQRATQQ